MSRTTRSTSLRCSFENRTVVDSAILIRQLDPQPPGRFDVTRLENGIDHLYALGLYEGAWYDLERGPDGTTVNVTAVPRAWGQEEVHGGLAVSTTTSTRHSTWR